MKRPMLMAALGVLTLCSWTMVVADTPAAKPDTNAQNPTEVAPQPPTPPAAPPVPSTPTPPSADAPKMELSAPEWNFGEVWQGEPLKHSVTIKNVGKTPLTIDVRSSCGCTVPTKPKTPLEPGESDKMEISYDTAKRKGAVTQTVTITTNDPTQPSFAYPVKGTVKALYETKPQDGIIYGNLTRKSVEEKSVEIEIKYTDKISLKLKEGQSFDPFEITFKEVEAGAKYAIIAKPKPPLKDGMARTDVTLVTGIERIPEIKIPVYGFVQPNIAVRPPRLFLPKGSTTELERPFYIQFMPDEPVKIKSIKPNHDSITATLASETPAQSAGKQMQYEVKVKLPPGDKIPDGFQPEIVIETDSTEDAYKTIKVPIQVITGGGATQPPPGMTGATLTSPSALQTGETPTNKEVKPPAPATPPQAPATPK